MRWSMNLLLYLLLPLYLLPDDLNLTVYDFPSSLKDNNVVFLYAHGLRSTHAQALKYTRIANDINYEDSNKYWIMDGPVVSFDFPDTITDKKMDKKKVNLGQEVDMEQLHRAYQETRERYPAHDIVLVGVSRGAVTILNYVALYQPEHVKAIIVESPFDTFKNVVKHLLRRFHVSWVPFSSSLGMKIAKKQFPQVDQKGIFPADVVHKISHDIAVMFTHTSRDNVCPINSSRKLYKQLTEAGHPHTYLLELRSGMHAHVMQEREGSTYQWIVQAFFKAANLPHNHDEAYKARFALEHCQPSIQDINKRIKKSKSITIEEFDEEYGCYDDYEENVLVSSPDMSDFSIS